MLCRKPFMRFDRSNAVHVPCPCGQCLPCRVTRRRLWTFRLLLESYMHSSNSFLTLTYDESNVPRLPSGLATLSPRDLCLFIKRLRRLLPARSLRFYAVGEYGDSTHRPHYHCAMFGLSEDDVKLVQKAWPKGHILLGSLTWDSAQYIVGYLVKRMTKFGDPRLFGRYPEFARMSNRPGIGALAMDVLGSVVKQYSAFDDVGDVPVSLKQGKKNVPLGRYLRTKLRGYAGFSSTAPPEAALKKYAEEVRILYQDWVSNSKIPTFKKYLVDSTSQSALQLEGRLKIFSNNKLL